MKKFLSLCLASLMILASASTVLADDGIMLISETTAVPDQIVIDDVNAPKTAPIYAYGYSGNFEPKIAFPSNPGQSERGIWFPRQVTIKVEAGENGSVDVPAKFFAAVSSSRTFNITPDAGYEVADIVVNGVSYGPAYSVKLKNIQVAMDIKVTFEPKLIYTPVYTENFDGEATAWVSGGTADAAVLADGTLTVTSTGGDPNINCPEAFGLACDDIDVIRVKYTNNTENTSFQIFFTNEANPGYSEAGSFKATCVPGANEIVIDTSVNELWTGTLSNMRIDLSNGTGSFVVDYISFETVSLDIAE
ncbi:MAG: hypothetical protein IJB52_14135 [Clostridia bacterium]|nr:hypothetical protein [Clostridia bacterium]